MWLEPLPHGSEKLTGSATPTAFALETIASYTRCFVWRAQWRFNGCDIEKTFIDEALSVTNRII